MVHDAGSELTREGVERMADHQHAVPEVLQHAAALHGIPGEGLARLAERGQRLSFPAGGRLMAQGELSHSMHIILKGRVKVERSHPDLVFPLTLAKLGPGETVGEMGVLDGAPHSATVIALDATETLELDSAVLTDTMRRFPDLSVALLRVVSRRLRNTDELAEEMLRKS